MSLVAATTASNLTQRRVAMLDHWAAIGVGLLEKVASEFERGLWDGIGALARISQAIRLAIALATRLSNPENPAFQPTPARARAAASVPAAPRDRVENEPVERPERERRMRGDREVSDAAILRRPLTEIVKVICRALGVTPDWRLWSDEDGASNGSEAPPAPVERPRPKPIPQPPRLHGPCLHRALGRRLIWISPTEPAPAPPSLRTRLRCSASPLALDPIAPPASGRFRLSGGR